ncbi:endonuclease/exonuclease/phosphatase family protein [Arthrobacter sp. GMC3]|uniref:endonuclease/exonuclease/phosphatase family protein n=1 Tax=Arthrobacter sp. GMC3 TaxID=2058894 RepID=UPI000CE406EE|nr:endonuclease/exonuclease/phosphatase family protein [Arthrobacter sp. GMC3]
MVLLQDRGKAPTTPRPHPCLNFIVVAGSLALTFVLLAHSWFPDVAGFGLIVDSGLIWLGALIPVLGVLAIAARRKHLAVAVLVPAVIWSLLFVPGLLPLAWSAPPGSANSLTVVSQNLKAQSGTAAQSAKSLAATGAQVVALQEIDGAAQGPVTAELQQHYGYSYRIGTVGLWSSYPILNAQPQGLGLGWNRALSADLDTPGGLVRIYVIHAASARPSDHAERDTMLANLSDTIAADPSKRIIAVGDFNAASTDRHFSALTNLLSEPAQDQGLAGFTWPATPFPVTRLDHILQRGLSATSNSVLTSGASDHLAIRTSFNL